MTWEKKTLSDVADFYNGKAHEKEISENGEFIIVNSKYISRDGSVIKRTKSQHFPLFHGDIVMVMSDVPNGKALAKCLIIDDDNLYSLNQRICCIRAKEAVFIPFLKYQLNRNKYFLGFNNGETQTNLRKEDILDCPINLPPLPVQKKIVKKLDAAFADIDKAISATEKNIENAEALLGKALDEMAFEKFARLGDVFSTGAGGTPLKSNNKFYDDGTIPWINSGEVNTKEIITAKKHITELGLKNSSAKIFPANTVLVAMYGATAGQVGILKFEAATNQAVCGIYQSEAYLPEFLFYFLTSAKEKIIRQASGVAQPNISQQKIKEIQIPVLTIENQYNIVKKFDFLSKLTNGLLDIYSKKFDNLLSLKSSLLNQALSGELTKDAA